MGNSSVLNLPTCASDHEIRERYRALSVIFHPDKQRDEATRETANKRFLEIQKAYEGIVTLSRTIFSNICAHSVALVLSDPFLRYYCSHFVPLKAGTHPTQTSIRRPR